MLRGIDPLLTGEVLLHLDRMGHSDLVVIADAHFPAYRIGREVVEIPVASPLATRAVRSVLELDDIDAVALMDSGGAWNDVQRELIDAAEVDASLVRAIERYDFYQLAGTANLVVRTAETRIYANVILRKGVTPAP